MLWAVSAPYILVLKPEESLPGSILENLFTSALLAPFELVINRVVASDPHTQKQLPRYAGKILAVESTKPALRIFIHFNEKSVQLSSALSPTSDGRVCGTGSELLKMLSTAKQDRSLANPQLSISGDVEFVQEIYYLFMGLDVNWQEPLSLLIGNAATGQLESAVSGFLSWTRESFATFNRNLDEYLHEEARLMPTQAEIELFSTKLDSLKLRIDRLSARREFLQEHLAKQLPDTP